MYSSYYAVFLLFLVAVFIGLIMAYIGVIVRPDKPDKIKYDVYECGVPVFGDARKRYNAKFYIVAMLFVIFDVETVFLFPWVVSFDVSGLLGLSAVLLFIAILVIGFFYEWSKGAFEWD
ncbi:MAG: NADH-quinone oxidoreductase subunit A [Deferribacterota bacterium]|nr:NADH-quinone oxidoreductase subunit A [Deferribacterota bacterium]